MDIISISEDSLFYNEEKWNQSRRYFQCSYVIKKKFIVIGGGFMIPLFVLSLFSFPTEWLKVSAEILKWIFDKSKWYLLIVKNIEKINQNTQNGILNFSVIQIELVWLTAS